MRLIITILVCIIIPFSSYAQQPEVSEAKVHVSTGKNFIKGLKGTDSLSIGRVTLASMIAPGYAQAYNRQYWKIPVIYGSAATFIAAGVHSKSKYNDTGLDKYKTQSSFYYAGAGLIYLGSIIDGIANQKRHEKGINPTKATLFSCFIPGLGQAYNGDYWKLPLVYGGLGFFWYWYDLNNMQYKRYRTAYNEEAAYLKDPANNPQSEFHGWSLESIKNRRNNFRRQKDYGILYLALWYAVTVVDATVFAQLSNFDVSENLAFNVSPAILPQSFAYNGIPAIGLSMRITMK